MVCGLCGHTAQCNYLNHDGCGHVERKPGSNILLDSDTCIVFIFYVVLIFVNWSCSVLAGYVEEGVGGDVVCGSK